MDELVKTFEDQYERMGKTLEMMKRKQKEHKANSERRMRQKIRAEVMKEVKMTNGSKKRKR